MRYPRLSVAVAVLLLPGALADVRNCDCDAARPETLERRECSLCRAVEAQPAGAKFFVIRDANPNKPHRWLALPRFHGKNPQDLSDMKPEDRTAYWQFAIGKATEMWGTQWALAI